MTKRIEELELQIGQDDETLNWEVKNLNINLLDKQIFYFILF